MSITASLLLKKDTGKRLPVVRQAGRRPRAFERRTTLSRHTRHFANGHIIFLTSDAIAFARRRAQRVHTTASVGVTALKLASSGTDDARRHFRARFLGLFISLDDTRITYSRAIIDAPSFIF